ncbi:MAG: hypothetical protein EOP36_12520 [Rubrivivax sp.]|nr:MAG: hypothetical protein EOP36_12520 [Rubrivivax sp.]
MNSPHKIVLAALIGTATAALLVACGGDDGPVPRQAADVTAEVPAAAATSSSVATTYVTDLSAVPAATSDTLEPVTVPEMLAADDSAEPSVVN